MKKRVIGGTVYAVLFYFTLLTDNLFYGIIAFFAIFGTKELINVIRNIDDKFSKILSFLYAGCFVIFLVSLLFMYRDNPIYVMFFAAVIMLNDTFAYICGKKYGKTKFSEISPNKTIEGLVSGIIIGPIFALLLFIVLGLIFQNDILIFNLSKIGNFNPFNKLIYIYIYSLIIAVLANVGDLVESYFKRKSYIKDSGSIVYGHGGVLDRMDSLIFPMILIFISLS